MTPLIQTPSTITRRSLRAGIVALFCATMLLACGQSANAQTTTCTYPSATYNGKGNFFSVFHETLSAEVCHNGVKVWTVWTSHRFSGVPGWSGTELGRGVFWDPGRYGGALTVWSNDQDTFGWGPVSYNEDTFLRIWIKPNGQTWTFEGL